MQIPSDRSRIPDRATPDDERTSSSGGAGQSERPTVPSSALAADRAATFFASSAIAETSRAAGAAIGSVGVDVHALRDAAVGARLDDLRDRFSGPYRVGGETVTARPMFRMNAGANEAKAKAHAPELARICARAGIRDFALVCLGSGTPEQLVKVTQALIDAGKLPPPPPGDVATRIRQMQWEWGIGVDCAGYTLRAAVAASGASAQSLGLALPGVENFRQMGGKNFSKVDPTVARPGDVITLDPVPPETVGHNVIVRSHTIKDGLHVFEVDSSWGAGVDGADYGGFRRDTWTYDDTPNVKMWSWTDNHASPPRTMYSTDGPSGERFHGCYRPKVGT